MTGALVLFREESHGWGRVEGKQEAALPLIRLVRSSCSGRRRPAAGSLSSGEGDLRSLPVPGVRITAR